MTLDELAERSQPEPEQDYALEGATELVAADFERVWWHVPGARRARAVLLPALALTALIGSMLALIPDSSWAVSVVPFGATLLLYVAASAARRGFARLQLERWGPGAVEYRLDTEGVQLSAPRVTQGCRWTELRGFLDAEGAFVLYPRVGKFLLVPKRAFGASTEHVRWFLARRAREVPPPRWGLRLGLGVVSLMAFLMVWHFYTKPSAQELEEFRRKNAEPQELDQGQPAPNEAQSAGAAPRDPTDAPP